MLHGTNSKERYIGAVSVIRWLSKVGAVGVVTTHDLALADVEDLLSAGLVTNMHFGDDIEGDEIQFDYAEGWPCCNDKRHSFNESCRYSS